MPNFTESYIERLKPAKEGKRYSVKDDKVSCLICRVTDKGIKTYVVYKKHNGRPLRITVGKNTEITLIKARAKALEIISQLSEGKNPNIEKNRLKEELVLQELFDEYIEKYSKKHTKQRTWQENIDIYNRYFKSWDYKKITSITKNDIEKLHTKLGNNNGIYSANNALTLIRHVFNKAVEWGYVDKNPAIGIKKYKTKSRDRFIQPEEMAKLFKAINEYPNDTAKDFFYISIYTGQRKSNVLSMRWEEINFNNQNWHIPETKNGESLDVPLVEQAVELLKERYQSIEKDKTWVFPSKASASGHFEEPKTAWKSILKKAELENLRIHDIRRTLGSYQAITGASLPIIGKSLGHKTANATQIYARLNQDPVRASMATAVNMIEELGKKND
ncbi:MAG: tyrosine-type recombinase/integrase [Alphaproteobacteria bacterium]